MSGLAIAFIVVFAVNTMPALMPPTWAILAFLHLAFGVPVLPLAVCGAVAAAGGRLALALLSRRFGRRALAPERRESLARLGEWLDAKARWTAPLAVLAYSFGPIPSNQLFIAAGLTRMSLAPVFTAFLAGRLVSYPLWIGVAHVAASRLDEVFGARLANVPALLVEAGLLAVLVAFTRVDWLRMIARFDPEFVRGRVPGPPTSDERPGPGATFGPRAGSAGERASRP